MPSTMKPKWDREVRPIRRRMSSWPIATSAPYTIEIRARVTTTGVAQTEASGRIPRQMRTIPKVPILSSTHTSSTLAPAAYLVEPAHKRRAGAGGGVLGGVAQPGVDREHRSLHGEGDEEAGEQP